MGSGPKVLAAREPDRRSVRGPASHLYLPADGSILTDHERLSMCVRSLCGAPAAGSSFRSLVSPSIRIPV
ncbi:protein of unknown function [Nitrospira japonica]|uniref:Uncharacterized protein n=1 Tax=Nitrospira japonica TaxID=1325564 RepID=A0A1W1I3G1_9BACT|nr:protein of unknown function [Nitrospira japonica]